MPKAFVLASKGISLTSRIIRFRQWGFPFTHIAFVADLKDRNDPAVIEAWWNGVRYGKFSKAHTLGTVFSVYSVGVTEEQKDKIYDFLFKQIGKPYDWLGILGFVFFNPNLASKNRWFCSELVFTAFLKAGIVLLKNTHPSEVSPRIFLKSPLLRFEYATCLCNKGSQIQVKRPSFDKTVKI